MFLGITLIERGVMELYKKYRPKTLRQMVGNESVINSIKNIKDFPHAMLFTGPPGCGKTTLGRIIAKMLGSYGLDYVEMDTAVFRGIDTVRDIRSKMYFKPTKGKNKTYLLDECHQLGTGGSSEKNIAQNGLLKALEDTPPHVYFILCTTNPEMLIPTIRSRCTIFEMQVLSDDDMGKLLTRISLKEKRKIPDEVKEQIIEEAQGHPRHALNILDKVLLVDSEKEMLQIASEGNQEEKIVNDLSKALFKGDSWATVSKILKNLKGKFPEENIRRSIMGYMSAIMLNNPKDERAWYIFSWFYEKNTFDTGFPGIVFCCKAICAGIDGPY